MFLAINKNYDYFVEVKSITRDMILTASNKKEFFINLAVNSELETTIEYFTSFVNTDITLIELCESKDEDTKITSYTFQAGHVDSIHEVVENGIHDITVLINY